MKTAQVDPRIRFLKYVRIDPDGCWRWTGAMVKAGYGTFFLDGSPMKASRASRILFVGDVLPRQHVHHDCPNKECVNPSHLRPLNPSLHMQADAHKRVAGSANRAKTHCKYGHEYSPENTWIGKKGSRFCKQCNHDRGFARRIRLGEIPGLGIGGYERAKTHCPRGHEYTAENTFIQKKGSRVCRTCKREKSREARLRKNNGSERLDRPCPLPGAG